MFILMHTHKKMKKRDQDEGKFVCVCVCSCVCKPRCARCSSEGVVDGLVLSVGTEVLTCELTVGAGGLLRWRQMMALRCWLSVPVMLLKR